MSETCRIWDSGSDNWWDGPRASWSGSIKPTLFDHCGNPVDPYFLMTTPLNYHILQSQPAEVLQSAHPDISLKADPVILTNTDRPQPDNNPISSIPIIRQPETGSDYPAFAGATPSTGQLLRICCVNQLGAPTQPAVSSTSKTGIFDRGRLLLSLHIIRVVAVNYGT